MLRKAALIHLKPRALQNKLQMKENACGNMAWDLKEVSRCGANVTLDKTMCTFGSRSFHLHLGYISQIYPFSHFPPPSAFSWIRVNWFNWFHFCLLASICHKERTRASPLLTAFKWLLNTFGMKSNFYQTSDAPNHQTQHYSPSQHLSFFSGATLPQPIWAAICSLITSCYMRAHCPQETVFLISSSSWFLLMKSLLKYLLCRSLRWAPTV